MTCYFTHRRAILVLRIAIAALLFASLSPVMTIWRSQSQPALLAALCTSFGFVKVAIGDETPPAAPGHHAPLCAWCVASATWLALACNPSTAIATTSGTYLTPDFVAQPVFYPRIFAFAWAQAPPVIS